MSEIPNNIYQRLVNHFGNQESTAKALLVKQPSVSNWVNEKKTMSERTALRAEKVTHGQFKAIDLCPALAEFNSLRA
ncbi:helix-turn-helix domain-containing protein [Acinetobacter gyllenbergii]|uniref:helix-turn-helix domain-containing protein n=1 Tax=Acinetobacter gyllenbergii TaxID=134534 RepID=UPI0021D33748|nr:helix-turn-helix domain-containing protein [Acinetobacter gyllenbergii]MCU4582904.1 helix-turn-helix domain-containing protein [Acinetobacter gyllenbergii]